jgi:hypothetical protein
MDLDFSVRFSIDVLLFSHPLQVVVKAESLVYSSIGQRPTL